jgi:7,8-dihydropterin-6-yl-methyl-4-(beta-D-ribofuranosyl)aminobenzene 5'-phosphate synthase
MINKFLTIFILATLISCNNENTQDVVNSNSIPNKYSDIPNNTIINLYDAFGDDSDTMVKDFGFSCIVKYDNKTILFDAGTNADKFKKNVDALKIDLTQIDFAVASHAHFDHINGFDYLLEINPDVKIYFPFDIYWGANFPFNLTGLDSTIADSLDKKMQYFEGDYESYQFNQTGRFWKANIEYIKNSCEVAPGIKLIATSSPYLGYFTKYPNIKITQEDDSTNENISDKTRFIELPELSLALTTKDGEVLIVGCSHSTVEKIITETKSYIDNEITLVYGGYHLLPYDRKVLTELSIRLKNDLNVKRVAPAHCTGHLAFKILQDYFQEDYIYAGLGEAVKF